jgi:hypothetical protein
VAYSIVSLDEFEYRVGQEIHIFNFNPQLNKVCVDGVHFHKNIADTYKWFEHMFIPHVQQDNSSNTLDIVDQGKVKKQEENDGINTSNNILFDLVDYQEDDKMNNMETSNMDTITATSMSTTTTSTDMSIIAMDKNNTSMRKESIDVKQKDTSTASSSMPEQPNIRQRKVKSVFE